MRTICEDCEKWKKRQCHGSCEAFNEWFRTVWPVLCNDIKRKVEEGCVLVVKSSR